MLMEIKRILPKHLSISGFIREVLEQEIRRRKMIDAGKRYSEFLTTSSPEQEWLDDWESADLAKAPLSDSDTRKPS